MRTVWLTLAFTCLILSFGVLAIDFMRLFSSNGELQYLDPTLLLPSSTEAQVRTWAALEGSTWGNVNRILLEPLMSHTPLWVVLLILALIFRLLGRKPA